LVVENAALAPATVDYSIEVSINPTCGDGFLDGDETCDDGNVVVGDGCSDVCEVEFGSTCDTVVPANCEDLSTLGNYSTGDVITDTISMDPTLVDETDAFMITFDTAVVLQGTLKANGTGDYDFFLENAEGNGIISAVDGDEEFVGFLRAGTYKITILAFTAADTGYTLALDLGHPLETHAAGATVSGAGGPLDTDQLEVFSYTFSEDVALAGTLAGTTTSDMDLIVLGTDGFLFSNETAGDEIIDTTLLAGTYIFVVSAFDAAQDTFALDFTTATAVLADIGTFAAAAAIADTVGGAITASGSVYHTITFSDPVLLTGLLDGNTTGALSFTLYNTAEEQLTGTGGSAFTDVALPAGTYIIKVSAGDVDVDAYNLALSTLANP